MAALPADRRVLAQGAGTPLVPRVYFNAPAKNGGHRALADIRESIAELRYYRQAMLVPPPGPDSATARAIATNHVIPADQG